jgi:uncharacterized protein (DUF2336 family)
MLQGLTPDALAQLQHKASPQEKIFLAEQLSRLPAAIPSEEENILSELVVVLVKDAELSVKQAFAHYLRKSPYLTQEIARKMAEDVESVALPVLENSELLSEEDLRRIVCTTCSVNKQQAIARREEVSETVSQALVDCALSVDVIGTLLENQNSRISSETLSQVVDNCSENSRIMNQLIDRKVVPVEIIQKIIQTVSRHMEDRIIEKIESKYGMSPSQLASIADYSIGLSLLRALESRKSKPDSRMLAENLHAAGKLNVTVFMGGVFTGKAYFVMYSLSHLAGYPFNQIEALLKAEEMPEFFETLLDRAELPASFAVDIFHAIRYALQSPVPASQAFVRELYTHIQENTDNFPNASYFFMMLQSHPYFNQPLRA